jgi:hypothetical protein
MSHYTRVRNRTILLFQKPDHAQCPALAGQILARACLPEGKSRMTPHYGLAGLGAVERATAHLPGMFEELCRKLERLDDKKSSLPVRCRTMAISWMEAGELPLEINVYICVPRKSCFGRAKVRQPATRRLPTRSLSAMLVPAFAETNGATRPARRRASPIDQ